jgi:hypothetical protein
VAALAAEAAEAGRQAAEAAARAREQATAEADRMVPEVEGLLRDAEARVRQAAAARGIALDMGQAEAQLEAAKAAFEEARKDRDARRFMDSRNKLLAISEALTATVKAIDTAIRAPR